jgi:hypothetical protein
MKDLGIKESSIGTPYMFEQRPKKQTPELS